MTNPDSTPEQTPSSGAVQVQPSPSATPQPDQVNEEEEQPQQQHPPFQSLFTLVTDGSGATHHPHVHYIFEDDDPDLLTDVLAQYNAHHHHQPDAASSGSKSSTPALLNDRAIVLDLVTKLPSTTNSSSDVVPGGANGYQVAWASSLSADWAVVSAALAPMNGAVDTSAAAATPSSSSSERLMLRIEGVDLGGGAGHHAASHSSTRDVSSGSSGGGGGGAHHQEDYNALVHEFDSRMAVLRKVVDAGAERQAKLAAGAQVSPRCEPPVAGVFENTRGGYGSSLPDVGHEQQQLDGGAGAALSGLERASGVSSERVSDSHGSGPQLVRSERASGESAHGAEGEQQSGP